MIPPFVNLDIELTNRCNAKCYFCPRDKTPHQGLMADDTFEATLRRAIEFRELSEAELGKELKIAICGLGEPLIHPRAADAVQRVRDEGFECGMASNGSLLTEKKGRALLDAGLQRIDINVGEVDDDYEDIYGLPFEKTLENVVRFAQMAGEQCKVQVVLVNHRRDPEHRDRMMAYWQQHGIEHFLPFELMNRGGALFVDHMQFETLPEMARAREMFVEAGDPQPVCCAPFVFLFVGYDGNYYLCCSDWTKEAPVGSVHEASFVDVLEPKLELVYRRDRVCNTCNLDPFNWLTHDIAGTDAGDLDARPPAVTADEMLTNSRQALDLVERLAPGLAPSVAARSTGRRRIPVTPV